MSNLNGNTPEVVSTGLPTSVPPLIVAFGSLGVAAASSALSFKAFKVAWENRAAVIHAAEAVSETLKEEVSS